MTLAEYNALPEDKRRPPITITDEVTGLPTAIAYFDGTFLKPATSNVGKVIEAEHHEFVVVWDGGMPDPKGGHTKGTLLDEFRSRDSLHHLRELYGKSEGTGSDEPGAEGEDSGEGESDEAEEEAAEARTAAILGDGYADLADAYEGTDE